MYHLVYLTRNLNNNKIYIGAHSTWNINDRYLGSGLNLRKSVKKYGRKNFERVVLHYCLDEEQMYEIEMQIVDDSFVARKDTYNLCVGGNGGWKNKVILHTEETKRKMREWQIGRKLSEETKKKMAESHKERKYQPHSEETKSKISKSLQGIAPWNKGKYHSTETKNKISESQKKNHSK